MTAGSRASSIISVVILVVTAISGVAVAIDRIDEAATVPSEATRRVDPPRPAGTADVATLDALGFDTSAIRHG